MTLSYLYKSGSQPVTIGPVNSLPHANIDFRPDTGQYWLPLLVHVSTRTGGPMRCSLRSGSIASLDDITSNKDFTILGANDTSTILSGTVISPGEGIRLFFDAGLTTLDTAYAEVVGLSSDIPPTLGIIPSIPGAVFRGASIASQQRQTIFSRNPGTISLPAGGGVFGTVLDMRSYQSYGYRLETYLQQATNFNPILVQMQWGNDSSGVGGTTIYEEVYGLFPGDANNQFGIYGRLERHDIVHGTSLQIFVQNNGPDIVNAGIEVWGSPLVISGPYMVNRANIAGGGLITGAVTPDTSFNASTGNVANGTTSNFAFPMRPGPASIQFNATGGPWTVSITTAVEGNFVYFNNAIPAGQTFTPTLYLPQSALKISVFNGTGGINNLQTYITSARNAVLL